MAITGTHRPAAFVRATGAAARVAGTTRRSVLFAALFYPAGLALYLDLFAPDSESFPIDFAAFWAAAKLAVQGATP